MTDNRVMKLILDRSTLENLLHHAAFAAHLIGHLDECAHRQVVDPLGDHVDAVVHGLTELLGDPRTLAACDSATRPDDRGGYLTAPTLPVTAGGAS